MGQIGGWAAGAMTAGIVAAFVMGACADKKGAIILAINTDMKAPKDVNAVSVTVSTGGAIKHSFIGRVTPQGEVLLPATLAIVEPDDKNASIRIRVMAFQDRKPRVLRDVRTTVPSDGRTALLRIPLNFVNDGSTKSADLPDGIIPPPFPGTGGTSSGGSSGTAPTIGAGEFDFFGSFQPDCADFETQTFIDGVCQDNAIDPATLPDFDESAVGSGTDPGVCFDVPKCFASAQIVQGGADIVPITDAGSEASVPPEAGAEGGADEREGGAGFKDYRIAAVTLDRASCALALNGANAARLNLALVTAQTGECVRPGECYIPIDHGDTGWKEEAGRVQLPRFVCTLLQTKNLRLATSDGTCAAKEASNPICVAAAPKVEQPPGDKNPTTCEGVCRNLASQCAPQLMNPKCVELCLDDDHTPATLACCANVRLPAGKCEQEGLGEVGAEDCNDEGVGCEKP